MRAGSLCFIVSLPFPVIGGLHPYLIHLKPCPLRKLRCPKLSRKVPSSTTFGVGSKVMQRGEGRELVWWVPRAPLTPVGSPTPHDLAASLGAALEPSADSSVF